MNNDMKMERDFKGIWIPKEIWLSNDLTLQEKVFLVEIDSLDNDCGCFASNSYFAEFFGLSGSRASQVISALNEKGYIDIDYEKEGKQIIKRILRINHSQYPSKFSRGGIKFSKGGTKFSKGGYLENCEDNNISNNNINNNNKENTNNIRNNSITHIISTKETAKTEDNSVENSVENKTEQKKEKTQTEKPIEKNNQLIKILSDRIPNKKARHLFVDFLNDRKNRLGLPVTYNFIMDALKYLDQYAGDDPEEIINVIHASIERGRGWIERVYTKNKKAVLTERSYDIKTLDEEYDIIAETGFQEETGDFLNTHKVNDDVKSTDFERISAELLAEDMETKQFKQIEEQKKAKIQELNDKIREIQDKIKATESNIEKQSLTIKLKELQVELALI